MANAWNFKAGWPARKGMRIASAYFEDIRKLLWAMDQLLPGSSILDGENLYDVKTGDLLGTPWNVATDYAFDKSDGLTNYETVIHWHPLKKRYAFYSNTRVINAGGDPPPANKYWSEVPLIDVYCDYAHNAGTENFMYCSHILAGPGTRHWPAHYNLPPQVNKYTQQRVGVAPVQWTLNDVYTTGTIVRNVAAIKAKRWWAKVHHKAVSNYSNTLWDATIAYAKDAKCKFNDLYYVATSAITLGALNPEYHPHWARAGAFSDTVIWEPVVVPGTSIQPNIEDMSYLQNDFVYDKKSEKPVPFSYNDNTGRENVQFLSGMIGTQYEYENGVSDHYYLNSSYPYDEESIGGEYNGYHYDFKKASYQSYIESFMEGHRIYDENPTYDINGSGIETVIYLQTDHYVFDCNESQFEKALKDLGSYDWYLDIRHPVHHNDGASAGNPIIHWRRTWKNTFGFPFSSASYPSGSPYAGQPLIWPQELGTPPGEQYQRGSIPASVSGKSLEDYPWLWWYDSANVNQFYDQAVTTLENMTAELRKKVYNRHLPRISITAVDLRVEYRMIGQALNDMRNLLLSDLHHGEFSTGTLQRREYSGYKLDYSDGIDPAYIYEFSQAAAQTRLIAACAKPYEVEPPNDYPTVIPKPTLFTTVNTSHPKQTWELIGGYNHPLIGNSFGFEIDFPSPPYCTVAQLQLGFPYHASDWAYDYGAFGSDGYWKIGWIWDSMSPQMQKLLLKSFSSTITLEVRIRPDPEKRALAERNYQNASLRHHAPWSFSTGAQSLSSPHGPLDIGESPDDWRAAHGGEYYQGFDGMVKFKVVEKSFDENEYIYYIMIKAISKKNYGGVYFADGSQDNRTDLYGKYVIIVGDGGSGLAMLHGIDPQAVPLGCVPVETDWVNMIPLELS